VATGDGNGGTIGGQVGLHWAGNEPDECVWAGIREILVQHGKLVLHLLDLSICACGLGR